ncbi:hypothetical protein PFISCL1PPCAC_6444, partial [Pristionchus fissidentatus]
LAVKMFFLRRQSSNRRQMEKINERGIALSGLSSLLCQFIFFLGLIIAQFFQSLNVAPLLLPCITLNGIIPFWSLMISATTLRREVLAGLRRLTMGGT